MKPFYFLRLNRFVSININLNEFFFVLAVAHGFARKNFNSTLYPVIMRKP